jgi:hypothetical protein
MSNDGIDEAGRKRRRLRRLLMGYKLIVMPGG